MKNIFFFLFGLLLLVPSCKKDQLTIDKELIADYLKEHNLTAKITEEGLYYIIETEGNGKRPSVNDQVKVHYKGTLLDGKKFDSSYDRGAPSTFFLSQVIAGWQIGIPLIKEGGKGKLIVPSKLGYGSNPPSGIPENAVLVFDIELLEVL